MLRQRTATAVMTTAVVTTMVLGSCQWALGQFGVPPSQRHSAPAAPQNNNQQQPRETPPGPSLEDILQLLLPPPPPSQPFVPYDDVPFGPIQPPPPPVPTSAGVARMPIQQQRSLLRTALQKLDEDLARLETGASWQKHLQIEVLGSGLWTNGPASPEARTRAALTAVADRFDAVAENANYQAIHRLWGFQTIRAALREYSIEPIDRSRRTLRGSSQQLIGSLDQVAAGVGWKKYLKIDQVQRLAQSKTEPSPEDRDILREIAQRFAEVNENPDYQAVARMNGFAATQSSLQQLEKDVLQLANGSTGGSTADEVLQLADSTSKDKALIARRMLVELAASLQSAHQACQAKTAAQQAWAKAAGSPANDPQGKLYLAAKQNHDEALAQSRERIDKIKRLIEQTMKDHQAARTAQDACGTVTLLRLTDDDSSTGESAGQMLRELVATMRAVDEARREKTMARQAGGILTLADDPPADDPKGKLYLAAKQTHDQAMAQADQRMENLKRLIASIIADNKAKQDADEANSIMRLEDEQAIPTVMALPLDGAYVLPLDDAYVMALPLDDEQEETFVMVMPLDDDEEEIIYTLMQFSDADDEEEEPTVTLMQFRDVVDEDEQQTVALAQFEQEVDLQNEGSLEAVVAALEAAPQRPAGLSQSQSQALSEIVAKLKAGETQDAQSSWQELVVDLQNAQPPVDMQELIRTVLREAYADALNELKYAADRVQYYNDLKKELGEHLKQLREILGRLDGDSRVSIETIDSLPDYLPGQRPYTIWKQKTLNRDELAQHIAALERQLAEMEEKAQLASADLQDQSQKQQQLLQLLSNVSKMLNDSAMAEAPTNE